MNFQVGSFQRCEYEAYLWTLDKMEAQRKDEERQGEEEITEELKRLMI